MKNLWNYVYAWWKSLWHRTGRKSAPSAVYRATFVEDDQLVPKVLPPYTVYIVGSQGNEWLAVMNCPCGCGETLPLNLLQDEAPNWTWSTGMDGAVTLKPSVWRKVRCKSHFFLRNGEISWCDL
jgi:hypothetical protein